MKREKNYNYAFLFYDVGEKRVHMTPSKLISLRNELKKVINDDEDFVCIVKLMNDNVFGEEVLGNAAHETGEDLII